MYDLHILDTEQDEAYDAITRLAANIMDTPYALISLIDKDRQWFKSKIGFDQDETGRDEAFCAHAILNPFEQLIVKDATQDERFADNPYVTPDNGIRFYFGTPLLTSDNLPIGTICAIDTKIQAEPTPKQRESLICLSKLVMMQMELRQFIIDINDHIGKMQTVNTDVLQTYSALNDKMDTILERVKARKAAK